MKKRVIIAASIALALSSQYATAGSIADTYTTGDALTAAKMDNIKTAVNGNNLVNDSQNIAIGTKQNSVTGNCPVEQSIWGINPDGSVNCEVDSDTIYTDADAQAAVAGDITAALTALENQMVGAMIGVAPVTNVKQSSLVANGWTECWSETYATTGTLVADVLAACNQGNLMMACRLTGSTDIIVAASAPVGEVTTLTTTDNTTVNPSNGVDWYYNDNKSWGFALTGSTVEKSSCDITDTNAQYRLCTHTGTGTITAGYKCGVVENLNSSTAYELVFLHKN